jgi:ATP-dependent Clp protease protease subunit
MLDAVKDSIINAYEIRTGLSRKEISRMMDAETWFDAHKAVELGFADGILQPVSQSVIAGQSPAVDMADAKQGTLFSRQAADTVLVNKLRDVCPAVSEEQHGVDAEALYARLEALK